MSLRDRSESRLRQLTLGEVRARELLEAARDAGESVTPAELEQAIGARYINSLRAFADQLRLRGLAPGVEPNGDWTLGYPKADAERDGRGEEAGGAGNPPPFSAETPAASVSLSVDPERSPGAPDDGRPLAATPGGDGASSGAPQLFELPAARPSGPYETREAA